MTRFKYKWPRKRLEICYLAFIRPWLEYGDILLDNYDDDSSNILDNSQFVMFEMYLGFMYMFVQWAWGREVHIKSVSQ